MWGTDKWLKPKKGERKEVKPKLGGWGCVVVVKKVVNMRERKP